MRQAAAREARDDAKQDKAAANLLAIVHPDTVSEASSRAGSWPSVEQQGPPSTSSRAESLAPEDTRFFRKDAAACVAYGDVPDRLGGTMLNAEALAFTRLLDAQVDVLVELDEVATARARERDGPVLWKGRTKNIEDHWVAKYAAEDAMSLTPLLQALVERCVALVRDSASPLVASKKPPLDAR